MEKMYEAYPHIRTSERKEKRHSTLTSGCPAAQTMNEATIDTIYLEDLEPIQGATIRSIFGAMRVREHVLSLLFPDVANNPEEERTLKSKLNQRTLLDAGFWLSHQVVSPVDEKAHWTTAIQEVSQSACPVGASS